jgi:hypothetical protein
MTPFSGGVNTDANVIPVHNPQMRAPNISTPKITARKVAETPSLRGRGFAEALSRRSRKVAEALSWRIAWAEALCRKIDEELLANIAKPSPGLMTQAHNSSNVRAFHQTSKTKSHSSTLCDGSPDMRGSAFDRREYVASCVALCRRMRAQPAADSTPAQRVVLAVLKGRRFPAFARTGLGASAHGLLACRDGSSPL